MPLYKVSFEIQVNADCPLNAAKNVINMLDINLTDPNAIGWQYYVQEENSTEVFSIDLDKEDENAVLPIKKYNHSF